MDASGVGDKTKQRASNSQNRPIEWLKLSSTIHLWVREADGSTGANFRTMAPFETVGSMGTRCRIGGNHAERCTLDMGISGVWMSFAVCALPACVP